jgi:hypothetical protein
MIGYLTGDVLIQQQSFHRLIDGRRRPFEGLRTSECMSTWMRYDVAHGPLNRLIRKQIDGFEQSLECPTT